MEFLPTQCIWVWLFFLQLWVFGNLGCLEEERVALLNLKPSMNFSKWEEGIDCCRWEGIKCSRRTGRIIELDLSEMWDDPLLNSTLLLPFQELQSLDLSSNQLAGLINGEELAALTKLETLDLSGNNLVGSIPQFIKKLTSLHVLSLGYNYLNGSLQGLCELNSIQELYLRFNEFQGSIAPCFCNLTSLRVLDLAQNNFSGKIPSELIINLSSLEYISLRWNQFQGVFYFSLFANHSRLKDVDLSWNHLDVETENPPWIPTFQLTELYLSKCNLNRLSGVIPSFLSTQYDLRNIQVSHNNLQGKFPTWWLENNTKLEILVIRNNSFFGPLNLPPHFKNDLTFWFDVSHNRIDGQLPADIGNFLPNLYYLNASFNNLGGSIPRSIAEMKRLELLDLSNNTLSGEIPEQMAIGCSSLGTLKLSNNRFHGRIFPTNSNLTQLRFLYLDGNQLTGKLSDALFNNSMLLVLDVSSNAISGKLPSKIGSLSQLQTLVLSDNQFKGSIPVDYCKLHDLRFLDLSQNSISGSIPPCSNLSSLRYVHLQENKLTGLIMGGFLRNSSLMTVDIRDNKISGRIPNWIGSLTKLKVLLLKGNHLQGHIPIELCQLNSIGILDLSNNSLSGPIPRCLNNITFGRAKDDAAFVRHYFKARFFNIVYAYNEFERLRHGYGVTDVQDKVEFMTKSRSYSYEGRILNYMSGLDLSCNRLTGKIPLEIGQLTELHALNLSNNQLTGLIPITFSNLKQIESLDLSHNRLNGTIPSELTELNYLAFFLVGQNNLSGRIPERKGQFITFGEASYEGNPFLCGPPLNRSCSSPPPSKPTDSDEEREDKGIDHIIFIASFIASYVVWFFSSLAVLYWNRYWQYVPFCECIY